MDWLAESLLQPLPRTVSPAPDETLLSYLRRLAQANGIRPWELTSLVKGSKRTSDPVLPTRMITLSGQPPDSMRYAILELCTPGELAVMNVVGRPRPGHSIADHRCTLCAGTSDLYEDRVTCWRRHEDVICIPHRRWTAGGEQLDLAGHDDIIQASKQHRRLIRRHGRAAVSQAFAQASSIIEEWATRPSYRERFSQLMSSFQGGEWRVFMHAPAARASCYVPAVALTRLLASATWKALALDPEGNDRFVDEVRRTVEPSYSWHPYPYWRYVEPLARTLQREADGATDEEEEAEFRRRHNISEPPPPPSEVIESSELCHHS